MIIAKFMTMAKSLMMIKCPLSASRFDCHGGPPVQYKAHLLMEHVQGYTRSHWMPPSGDYSIHIATAAAGGTANKTTMNKWANFAGHFDGCGGAPVRFCVSKALVEATGCRHQASIAANSYFSG
jgi:hypothetical protein